MVSAFRTFSFELPRISAAPVQKKLNQAQPGDNREPGYKTFCHSVFQESVRMRFHDQFRDKRNKPDKKNDRKINHQSKSKLVQGFDKTLGTLLALCHSSAMPPFPLFTFPAASSFMNIRDLIRLNRYSSSFQLASLVRQGAELFLRFTSSISRMLVMPRRFLRTLPRRTWYCRLCGSCNQGEVKFPEKARRSRRVHVAACVLCSRCPIQGHRRMD